jgi:hypothetical protein
MLGEAGVDRTRQYTSSCVPMSVNTALVVEEK